jgi:hypothetical protein
MTFPEQDLTLIDPGIGATQGVPDAPYMTGVAHGGSTPVNTVASISSLSRVRSDVGYGPLAEDIALTLSKRGGPVLYCIHSVTLPTLSGDMDEVGAGTGDIALSGGNRDDYSLAVEIVTAGVAGVGTFRYSLDYNLDSEVDPTWSRTRVIPGGLTFAIPNTGITLTFDVSPATYPAGALFTKVMKTVVVGTTDLTGAAGAILSPTLFGLWSVSGLQATETAGAAIGAALQGHLETLTTSFRYARGIIDVGSLDTSANVLSESDDWEAARICPAYGTVVRQSALPFEGFGNRLCSTQAGIAARAAGELISTDLSRTASGADTGVLAIAFDGFEDQQLDAAKISTMRTWPGVPGFYFANAKLHSGFGSDFTDLQYGRIMDVACRTVFTAQFPYISEGFRTVEAVDASDEHPVGSIDPLDAADVDASVTNALDDNLLKPNNARGRPGHVTAVEYEIDFLHNLNTSETVKSSVAIQPLGYAKKFETTLFFSLGS